MQKFNYPEKTFFHFSFLRDIKVSGVYFNSLSTYLELYPFIRKEHYHDFYSILLITNGDGIIRITDDNYHIQSQTLYLISPNQMHSFEKLRKAEGVLFFFCQDFYVEEFSYIRLLNLFSCSLKIAGNGCNPYINLKSDEFRQVSDLLKSIEAEYNRSGYNGTTPVIIRSLLNILLLRLLELYDRRSQRFVKADNILVHGLSILIDSHFIKEHQTRFYAASLNVSEKHVNDLCNNYFNCSLKKILTDRLMQEARKLLLSSDQTVSELSYKLNFEDNSYFNKVFKKNTGLTPKKFREIHRKLIP